MSYYTAGRQSPDKDDDMLFAVGYVLDGELKYITNGPYAKVGPARGQVTHRNGRKRSDTKGEYKLLVTKIDWVVVDE